MNETRISKHFEDYLWEYAVKPAINISLKDLDSKFSQVVNLEAVIDKQKFENNYKTELSKIYEKKRDWLKKHYYSKYSKDEKLDLHKIAAIVARSVIALKPISFSCEDAVAYINDNSLRNNSIWYVDNYSINYKIAFISAIAIMFIDIIYKGSIVEDTLDVQKVKDICKYFCTNGFDLYSNSNLESDHEPFYRSLIIDMMINDINGRDFDYLGFAANIYQLENHEYSLYLQRKGDTNKK